MADMAKVAEAIAEHLRAAGFTDPDGQVLMLAEEAGEFVGAYRRYTQRARRSGSYDELKAELADVVIGAWVCAEFLGFALNIAIEEKLDVIFSRGWREEPKVAHHASGTIREVFPGDFRHTRDELTRDEAVAQKMWHRPDWP